METIQYPITQRRLRAAAHIRELAATTILSHKQFIQPLFVEENSTEQRAVKGLPFVNVDTAKTIIATIEADVQQGITKFLLFPIPATKHVQPTNFSFAENIVATIKKQFGNSIWLAVDICLCSYTTHGHCGILNCNETALLNNKTVQLLAKYATTIAIAGADCIAPSDMMDNRIAAIRNQLDALQLDAVSIMSYAAKFSSQLYGPFRDACHSTPQAKGLHNRKSYQISPFNTNDAIASALRDEAQGADILMIKPAALYTDIIAALKQKTTKPLAAYHVSGEYASIELLAQHGLADRHILHTETWAALARSGSQIIISYAARNAKQWIEQIDY
jgi:porphobilinogen synthase